MFNDSVLPPVKVCNNVFNASFLIQIDVCEAKFSGRVSCSAKYSRSDLGMRLKKHEISKKYRHYCRYSPKPMDEINSKTTEDYTSPPLFGPEIVLDPLTNTKGNIN